jgi:S-adenosylmethionine/arginine decarboxylase-like enzyme
MNLHRIAVNLYGCNNKINSGALIADALLVHLRLAGFDVLGQSIVTFQPHGSTAVFVFAESHAVISTWPETFFVSLDLALCAKAETGEVIIEAMTRLLQPRHVTKEHSTTSLRHHELPGLNL